MRSLPWVMLLGLAGCSGPPLKEVPVLEPPPETAAPEPAPATAPAPVPAEVPAALPEASRPAPGLAGAWRSREMSGPGSGAYSDVRFFFDADGTYLGLARNTKTTAAASGTYELREGTIVLRDEAGRTRTWTLALGEGRLTLGDGPAVLVLERLR